MTPASAQPEDWRTWIGLGIQRYKPGLQNHQRARVTRPGCKLPDPGVESRQLPPMPVGQQEKLHVRDLVGSDETRHMRIAQLPQIDVQWPVLMMGTPAIPVQTRQGLSNGIARATQLAARDAKEPSLRQRTCCPQPIGFPLKPRMRRPVRTVQRECQRHKNINVEERTHVDAPLRALLSPTRRAFRW